MKGNFLSDLNPAQIEAVKTVEGPELVIAGAGSGKTKVLTYRVAYLVSIGVPFHNILCLTFTNKAANEMKTRIEKLLDADQEKSKKHYNWIGTFHSLFGKILRMEAEKIGYTQNFTIYDEEDSLKAIKQILRENNYSEEIFPSAGIRWQISKLKNNLVLPSQFDQLAKSRLEQVVSQVYSIYDDRLKKNNAMDFDDLLIKPILLFNHDHASLDKYQNKFRFILVDEYQDTNRAQYILLKLLAERHKNLCVVGDDSQSIYSWRGADVQNILDFQVDYPKCKVFRLEQNYRSTGKILKAANSVIIHNKKKLDKNLWTENHEGEQLTALECESDRDEGYKIVQKIRDESIKDKLQLKDFVVLFRTNYQSRAMEEAFNRGGIPYTIVGGVAFYRRKEIKDILAYLKLIVNPSDDESFLRVVNFPARGIGDVTIDYLRSFSQLNKITLTETLIRIDEIVEIQPRQKNQLKQFGKLIEKYSKLRDELSISELTRSLTDETRIIRTLKDESTPEAQNRLENIQEFLAGIEEFHGENPEGTLQDFLAEVSLVADVDRWDTKRNSVTLMTVHAAKGLEFPVVFVSGLEEGLFPLSSKDQDELEEERRLFYVAITRAKRKVYLSHARQRYRFGKISFQSPSRFLSEIESELLDQEHSGRPSAQRYLWETTISFPQGIQSDSPIFPTLDHVVQDAGESSIQQEETKKEPEFPPIRVGSIVQHQFFGQGKVIEVHGKGDNERVVVLFSANQKKQLMVRYANLRIVK
ncbi:MAG TPA: UvrD-helicase domain-containing protein [Candidatus Acidoferrales bacterium]|nr:UvrD-helicase domain-containing protein [Candidatus Acidoferrales bacterium]